MPLEDEALSRDTAAGAEAANLAITAVIRSAPAPESFAQSVTADRAPLAVILWGWWVRSARLASLSQAAYQLDLLEAAYPVARSLHEHARYMLWLSDSGLEGVKAVQQAWEQHQRRLREGLRTEDWDLELPKSSQTAVVATGSLLNEFSTLAVQAGLYPEGAGYVSYRLQSAQSHPSYGSAKGYVRGKDGIAELVTEHQERSFAPLLEASISLICAAQVVQREAPSPLLAHGIDEAFDALQVRWDLPARATSSHGGEGNDTLASTAADLLAYVVALCDVNSPLVRAAAGEADHAPADLRRTTRRKLQSATANLQGAHAELALLLGDHAR